VRNPYDVLGVASTASSADIQKAYRKLANVRFWGEAEGADGQTPLDSVENDPKRTFWHGTNVQLDYRRF
jgi:hypothetical protein